ncbi:hypothetical protein PSN45_000556 [Yamadazyma tenuis]|uniref:26S proteasome complex subunit SEM1 n=1 Tax=Candida tenuis (strain ATCC 10573 / BCRC 21748 / CBS 615 / JCM 9827 / NBRC 10315 / NRRL Y-1498 / VKM Y-70) TaxID=590646 RepID=G3B9E5_CANTC|nr:uncharacterized protein CANTEDRAFT_115314 [Yamadazyma tenuis ATCC 10573]EGV61866.1 hypothetical protein CANTEDRAFT_115314 [Yamadazyma tenuis ATCC 10573]WEJ93095.1 hypothetical protein PSN45_000556 [Yamadazyma tenuis]
MSSKSIENGVPTEDEKKVIKSLEEDDDEFEDFPADTKWTVKQDPQINPDSLWEEDWEDDDNEDDFSAQLKTELEKHRS